MIIIFITIAAIWAIVDIIRLPKPPKNLTQKQLEYYYRGGWKEYEAQKQIDEQLRLQQLEANNTTKRKLYKDIDFLTAQVNNLEDLQRLIEKDLHNGSGNEKANLSRLISIDKQIYITQKKIEKLNSELENL